MERTHSQKVYESNMPRDASKRFCFTLNNPSESAIEELQAWATSNTTYLVYGVEIGASGTKHLQGYFERSSVVRLSTVRRKKFGNPAIGWHCEIARGSGEQCRDYCQKGKQSHAEWELDGVAGAHYGEGAEVWQIGEMKVSRPGKRSDLEKVREGILDGTITNPAQIAFMSGVNLQGYRMGCVMLDHRKVPAHRGKPSIYWLYGSSGSGKTRAVATTIDRMAGLGHEHWRGAPSMRWFDGYHGQSIAWFDDFRFDGKPYDFARILQVCDEYSMRVEVKGGFTNWCPKFIFITAPKDVEPTFERIREHEDIFQMRRRVTRSFNFDEQGRVEFRGAIDTHFAPANGPAGCHDRGEPRGAEEHKEGEPLGADHGDAGHCSDSEEGEEGVIDLTYDSDDTLPYDAEE